MVSTTDEPTKVRQLSSPAANALADLASIFDDLQTVLRCCERLVTELDSRRAEPDDLMLEALWTTAVLSYTRCFAAGNSGVGLTEEDLTATPLQGEVLQWHQVLQQLRKHYANDAENPRERFAVGATQSADGQASGIALTSTRQPALDDITVRQTGALAYELSRLVDQRITAHQERVFAMASDIPASDMKKLPLIDIALPDLV